MKKSIAKCQIKLVINEILLIHLSKLYQMNNYFSIIIVFIALCFLSCHRKQGSKELNELKKPNILLIITDDQGYGDLGCHGNPFILTPNLDSMAAESTEFSNFYVSPVCAPTRSSLMTGKYYFRNGIFETHGGGAIIDPDQITVAEILKANGYKTGIFGKWHLGDNYPSRSIDQGFMESLTHRGGGIGQVGDLENYKRPKDCYFDPVLYRNGKAVKTEGYCSDIFTDATIDFIGHNKDRPFFAYLAYNAPHDPLQLPEEYYNLYKDLKFDEERQISGGLVAPALSEKEAESARRVYGMVTNIDDNIGRLINKLRTENLLDKTIVIFMSDNGLKPRRYNSGLRGLKTTVYEGGIKVPFFIQFPKMFPRGKKISIAAAHIDLLPTLLDLCNLKSKIPEDIDGKSLLPTINREDEYFKKRTLFWQWGKNYPELYKNVAVRQADFKLVGSTDFNSDILQFELYNIANDPGETTNIIVENKEVALSLKKQLDDWYFKTVVEGGNPKPQRILVDMEHEAPVILTRQDAKGSPGIWSQDNVFTYWDVEFEESGYYDFTFNFRKKPQRTGSFTVHLPPIKYSVENNDTTVTNLRMNHLYIPKGRNKMEVFYRISFGKIIAPFSVTIEKNRKKS